MLKYLFVFTIKKMSVENFRFELEKIISFSKEENGCLLFEYILYENQFFIFEIWENEQNFQKHLTSKELKQFRLNIKDFLLKEREKFVL